MTKELKAYQQKTKKCWESHSELARKIVAVLQEADVLQVPRDRRGWGLAAQLPNWVAEIIDAVLEEKG